MTPNPSLCRAFVSLTNVDLSTPTIARNIQKSYHKSPRNIVLMDIGFIQNNSASGEVRTGSGRIRCWKKLLKGSHRVVFVRRSWSRQQRCGIRRKMRMSTSSCSVGEVELVNWNVHKRFLGHMPACCPSALKRCQVIH